MTIFPDMSNPHIELLAIIKQKTIYEDIRVSSNGFDQRH